ncbi:phosphate/phosphite/phosphonate ABC transporter substrate-binding protein [Mucilaginibacter rubeus]|uniref:Phosphate/phosphite/phosphonate ABC transporter substrate-binding protein n=1 Tax=Mucilaginibacter rubeus TaxID=2027860 RepID=A0A5C1HT02_9SPHI|nr:phosphate/phosphite/phosphonate ABC transporter substrate-binding protein [Mucilaginibacter rubeus]QEM08982.1 phosphate/phosphite/phosphonate ABC transporter substrate-binding protein [Mucilaginibacter rubeus]
MKTFNVFLLVVAMLAAVSGCKNKANLDANGVPGKLLIGSYGGDNPAQYREALDPFAAYLSKKLGMEVEFFYTTDYPALIEAMRSKKIHMAHLTPYAYILATQKPGLASIVTLGIKGKPTVYHSIIFTNKKTGLKTMADVKARAKNLTLCFADPASTSGHLIPRGYLDSIGLDPDKAFKATIFAGSHAAAILSVKSEKVDVGCSTSELALEKLIREHIINREDIVILWTSPPIVNDAIAIRTDLNKDFINKVQQAYLNANHDDFEAFKKYVLLYWPNPHEMSYVPIQDSAYNQLRKIAGSIKDLKQK